MPWLPLETIAGLSGHDPYLRWAAATEFRDYAHKVFDHIKVAIELKPPGTASQFARELGKAGTVGRAYEIGSARFITCELTQNAFSVPVWPRLEPLIVRMNLAMDLLPRRTVRRQVALVPTSPRLARTRKRTLSKGKVLIGIIDTSLAFAHRDLRGSDGKTRVVHLWDQDPQPAFGALAGGAPSDFGYGREVGQKALQKQIDRFTDTAERVDENACYETCGYRELRERFAHGTAVASLLAGPLPLDQSLPSKPGDMPRRERRSSGGAVESDIVLVQLPRSAVQDGAGHGLVAHVLDGLRYIVSCAGKSQRIVVNVSYACQTGPHDGTSMLEEAIDELVTELKSASPSRDLKVVLPTGNTFLDRCHVRCELGNSPVWSQCLALEVPPGNEVSTFIEFWLPDGEPPISVELIAPDGNRSGPVTAGKACRPRMAGPVQAAVIRSVGGSRGGAAKGGRKGKELALIAISPTQSMDDPQICAPAGRWQVVLSAEADRSTTGKRVVEGWIAFNQRNAGAQLRGRQARFVDARWDPQRYLKPELDDLTDQPQRPWIDKVMDACPIKRRGSVSGLANGKQTAVVAGTIWRSRETKFARTGSEEMGDLILAVAKEHAFYSGALAGSGGALKRPIASKGLLSTSCEESWVLAGIPAAGSRSGSFVRARGTSFSVPQVARKLAEGWSPEPPEPVPLQSKFHDKCWDENSTFATGQRVAAALRKDTETP